LISFVNCRDAAFLHAGVAGGGRLGCIVFSPSLCLQGNTGLPSVGIRRHAADLRPLLATAVCMRMPSVTSRAHRHCDPSAGASAPRGGEAANLIRSADATLRAQCRGRLRDQLQPPQPTTPADRHRRWTRPSSAFSWSRSRRSAAAAGATARRRRRGRPWPQRGLASDGLRGRAAACARGRHVGPGAAHASALA